MKPQISQVARPVSGSRVRKLGQPLVRQKSWLETAVRRRRRRMALARPVRLVVVERDNTGVSLCFSMAGAGTFSSHGCCGLMVPLRTIRDGDRSGWTSLATFGAGAESCSDLQPLGVGRCLDSEAGGSPCQTCRRYGIRRTFVRSPVRRSVRARRRGRDPGGSRRVPPSSRASASGPAAAPARGRSRRDADTDACGAAD